jgi:mono/diheme cytochrome c family protein
MRRGWTRAGQMAGLLAGLVLLLVVILNGISLVRQQRKYPISDIELAVTRDSASISRGRHLVTAVAACTSCHGSDLGGMVAFEQPLLGRFVAANLTSGIGGVTRQATDQDLVRAIRHVVGPDGRPLLFMPSDAYQALSDREVAAIIAYLRTIQPIDRRLPPTRVGPLGRVLHVLGFPVIAAEKIDHHARRAAPPARVDVADGRHLATVAGCRGCHGPSLSGGTGPGPNLTGGALATWSEADFRRALREGRRPDGSTLAEPMPWRNYAHLTDEEVAALWRYLRSLQVS